MKDIFPTEGASVTVSDDMCDMNGHMNVRFYQTIPMDYDSNFYNSLGFGEDYIAKGYSSFTAEQNIRYLKECLKGEKLTPRFRMLNVNKKLYHYVCAIFKESDEVAALVETVEIHIDMSIRKSAEMPDEIFGAMAKMQKEHESSGDYLFETKLKIK
jgi:acyl-CoA thioester hydrolase